jgi:aspartyl-tRNA(Asn)/glutamyl-tRNA(Gln) amidotransferase subunit A
MSLHLKAIPELADGLAKKEFSSVELTQHFLARIKQHNPQLNAYLSTYESTALEQAKQADQRIADNQATSLTGIPLVYKDNFCIKNTRTTCASKMLENFTAPYTATCIQQLEDAGAVMLGKANLDEFAMGSSNETSYFGPCRNPHDHDRVPGGSSGGTASAVSARIAVAGTGSDTGGSIRQPASFTGITGLKPTYGRVSRYGMIAFASSLDQAGPMAATAVDCAHLLQHMAGHDPLDNTSSQTHVPNYISAIDQPLSDLKVGVPHEFFAGTLDAKISEQVHKNIELFQKMGATISTVNLKNAYLSVPTYYIIAPSECSSNLARFDGIHFGDRPAQGKNIQDMIQQARTNGFGKEVKRRIMLGNFALSSGFYDQFYQKAEKVRALIKHDFDQAFDQVDLILGPTTPTTAFKINEKTDDPMTMYLSDIYTTLVNLAGLPAINFPGGLVDGLPIGIQLIGPAFSEERLLQAVHHYQQTTEWHRHVPPAYR